MFSFHHFCYLFTTEQQTEVFADQANSTSRTLPNIDQVLNTLQTVASAVQAPTKGQSTTSVLPTSFLRTDVTQKAFQNQMTTANSGDPSNASLRGIVPGNIATEPFTNVEQGVLGTQPFATGNSLDET